MPIVHQSLKDFFPVKEISLEGLTEEEIRIKINEFYNEHSNKKQMHPKVKFYEHKAKLLLVSKRYSKAYKMLHKAKEYSRIDYKPIIIVDEFHMLFK